MILVNKLHFLRFGAVFVLLMSHKILRTGLVCCFGVLLFL